MTFVTFITF